MAFEGYIDRASESELSGWIFDNSAPDAAQEIEVMDGDKVIARITASGFRADLAAAGKGTGKYAFSFKAKSAASMPLAGRVVGKRWHIAPAGGHEASLNLPMRFNSKLAHSFEYGAPVAASNFGFSTPIAVGDDMGLAHRLMRAFAKTVEDNPDAANRKSDQWANVEHDHHQPVFALLKRGDARGLIEYLRDAHNRPLTYGITQGSFMTNVLRTRPDARRLIMLELLDHVTSLAEYLGVLDVECPDQHGQWGENIHSDPLGIFERISAVIGAPVVPPQAVGSAFGLSTGSGIVTTRDLLSLYAALRIQALVGATQRTTPTGSACEIGGGLGTVAYYANRLGVAQYTIIDLPLISLLQGFFLIRALPGVKIALYGEDMPDAAIRLLPTYAFAGERSSYDLLFNQDSMPEIHADYSIEYLRASRKKKISLFLSINQEARAPQGKHALGQTVVRELVAQVGGYKRQQRSRHWLRAGYVEELYLLSE